ncbi:hypothetical protein [Parasitella parasitica]|uniref:Helitron helicase-like domain-containing protein n=1 Tax=Parasitella parasitica TaxID=35722 RepID=A0A0B7N1T7_9FUNG|nr:hypothetical protein [Parasitella parasitica]
MNANLDQRYTNSENGAYAFRIHGSVHHLLSSTPIPESDSRPKFAQIYIFDSDNELRNRMNVAGNPDVNSATMLSLQTMMHEVNPFVTLFKTMEELSVEQPGGITDIRMIFRAEGTPDARRYNNPSVPEIGVLIVVLRFKGTENGLARINEIHQHFDPLQYVLIFQFGDPGWHSELRSHDPLAVENGARETSSRATQKRITAMQYYSLRLILNQSSLRAEVYSGLQYVIRFDSNDMSSIGKRMILPSTFIGGPRHMAQLYQDAMNLVRRFGKPDLFIKFTCNPAWPEITNELLENQKTSERPDPCARIFNLKLRQFLEDILKHSILGKVTAYVYPIEFQKRGLPH